MAALSLDRYLTIIGRMQQCPHKNGLTINHIMRLPVSNDFCFPTVELMVLVNDKSHCSPLFVSRAGRKFSWISVGAK